MILYLRTTDDAEPARCVVRAKPHRARLSHPPPALLHPPPSSTPPPQDCDTQLQRALNYENFDAAGNIRARRQKVDEALAALQEGKGQGGKSKQAEITDVAAEGLRVRSELQKAVEEER